MIISQENSILTLKYMTEEKENQFFDRKSARKPVKELANFVASFANASGGTLVIGIADDGKIEGFEDYSNKYNDFLKVTSIDYLKTIPNYKNETLEVVNYKGNKDKILLIHVQPSTDILIRNVKDEVYLRQGDSSNKLSSEQIRILEYDRREVSFEEEINTRSNVNNIDMEMAEIYKKAIGAENKDPLDVLRARNFLVKKDGEEHLTNSGILLFAEDPSIFFPTARVRVIKFDGTEMHTGAELNIVKDKTFALPLYKVIKETQGFVDTQLREFNHLGNNGEFVTVPEYPKFAWEERNHNAVCHRNYAISGEHTKIFIFDDRMEIVSPRKLPSIITIDNMKNERYARNPQISRVLTELGLVKELNEGVARIYKEMSEFFLDEPEYTEPNGMLVKLVLKNNIVMRNKRKNEKLLKEDDIRNNWEELNVLEQKVLQYIYDKGEVTNKEICEYIDRTRRTTIRILNRLEEKNLIEWIGTSVSDPKKVYTVKQKNEKMSQ